MSQATKSTADEVTDPDEVLVSSSTGRLRGSKTCHEDDGDGNPKCNSAGSFRHVEPVVYPDREPCSKEACWEDGVPDVLQDESTEADE